MSVINNNLLLTAAAGATGYQVSRSLRFNSADSAYLSKSFGSAGNRKTWTWSAWVKRSALSSRQDLITSGTTLSDYTLNGFGFTPADKLSFFYLNGEWRITTQVFRDTSAWYHIVLAFDTTQATAANRVKLYVNGAEITAFTTNNAPLQNTDYGFNSTEDHNIGRERYNSNFYFNGYMADIWFLDGIATDASSFGETDATTGQWIPKAYTGSKGTNGFHLEFADNSAATAAALGKDTSGNSNNWTPNNFSVTGLVDHTPAGLSYRDSSTTNRNWDQSTASSTTSAAIGPDRIYWIDLGSSKSFNRVTFSVVASGQSSDTSTNFITYFSTSSSSTGSSICGSSCTVTKAGSPSSTTPGTITVTFAGFASQNGRYIGIASGSGAQGGTYTYSNFKVYDDQGAANDSLVDTPTSYGTSTGIGGEQRGNYAVLNPLDKNPDAALANGNLDYTPGGSVWRPVRATIGVTSGKWYWEVSISNIGVLGIATQSTPLGNDYYPGIDATSYGYTYVGTKYNNGSSTSYGSSYTTGDLIGVAYDADNGKVWFSKNGTWQASGDPAAGTNAAYTGINTALTYFPMIAFSGTGTSVFNAGQRPFAYTAPSGFKALCDTNLPAPVVAKPNTAFDAVTYTGNGSARSITLPGGFSPDLIWTKSRSAAYFHHLYDIVRGTNSDLCSNSTTNELTGSPYNDGVTAFNSSGYSLGTFNGLNENGTTYVAWAWDGGTSTVTNTQGSINSQVRANTSAGFSVLTATTPTSGSSFSVGHGLGVAPAFAIFKDRGYANSWGIYHKSITTTTGGELLFTTAAAQNYGWFPSAPTSTTFTLSVGGWGTGASIVGYLWTPIVGYSSFGSYTGNGSSDGPFVFCGFRPRWLLVKSVNYADTWVLIDAARETYNVMNTQLRPNSSNAESVAVNDAFDFLSNGFKVRGSGAVVNTSAAPFIYCAFAESPFQYARAR